MRSTMPKTTNRYARFIVDQSWVARRTNRRSPEPPLVDWCAFRTARSWKEHEVIEVVDTDSLRRVHLVHSWSERCLAHVQ